MLPLSFAKDGEEVMIVSVSGRPDVKKHLEDLGFVPGERVHVVSSHNGDMILTVKDARLAVTREMATKIMIQE